MVEVDKVCLEDVVAIHCNGVDVLVDSAGVERGVVRVADSKGNGICDRWQEAAVHAHKVLSEGHLCVEIKVEATSASVSAARGPAATPAPRAWGVGIGAVVVARHYFWGIVGHLR